MATLILSPARPEEADQVVAMYEWLFAPPGVRPAGWTPDRAVAAACRVASGDSSVILIARLGAEFVGFCTVYMDIESVRFGRRAWVEDLAVDPRQRSRGVGKQLLDEAKRWARDKGAARLALESGEARTDAHRFYEREHPSWRSVTFGWELARPAERSMVNR